MKVRYPSCRELLLVATLAVATAEATAGEVSPGPDSYQASATVESGVWMGFRSWPELDDVHEYIYLDGRGVNRVVIDRRSGAYFGYRISPTRMAEDRIRVEIGPIPSDFDPEQKARPQCPRCPPFTPLGAKLVQYPKPQVLRDGSTFDFELLRRPSTGETLSDRVKVRLVPMPPRPMGSGPAVQGPTDRFRIEASVDPDPARADGLRVAFRVSDLASGEELRRVEMSPRGPEGGQLAFGGLSRSGAFFQARVEIKTDPPSATGTYSVEIREGEELVHAERVRFPWPAR
jgi:hypothetical protein